MWRFHQGRVSVRTILDHIEMDRDSLLCPCCQDMKEMVDYCFGHCKWVEKVWGRFSNGHGWGNSMAV